MMLGNLSARQIEDRLGIKFAEPFRAELEQTHNPHAEDIKPGKWHCFDIPFLLRCGDRPTADRIAGEMMKQEMEMRCPISIDWLEADDAPQS